MVARVYIVPTALWAAFDSLPAVSEISRDFSKYYLADPDNRQSQALQDLRRLRVWDLYISERLVVRLPLRFATLVAGDIVTFRSDSVEHLYDTVDPIYKGRYCMVLGCDYSIDAQECTVTLGVPSPKMQRTTDAEDTADATRATSKSVGWAVWSDDPAATRLE